jgi:hypothetical protein
MLDREKIKIKYIIGTYKDEPNYPTIEDFEYLIKNWYWNEGGHHFIHTYRRIEETGNLIFTDVVLKEKLENDEEVTNNLLNSLQESGRIKLNKATKFTNYYEFI